MVVVDTQCHTTPCWSEPVEILVKQMELAGAEGIRLRPNTRSPGGDPFADWRKTSDMGLPVSCSGTLSQHASPGFEGIVKKFPGLKIIIEHLAGVGGISGEQGGGPPHDAYRRVLELSKYPNTYMKTPGSGEISKRAMPVKTPFPFEDAPPLIELAIESFGGDRLLWGSDFEPSAGRKGYANTLKLPTENVTFPSQEAKNMIFGVTAASIWKFGG